MYNNKIVEILDELYRLVVGLKQSREMRKRRSYIALTSHYMMLQILCGQW